MQGAANFHLISVAGKNDVLQRRGRASGPIEEVTDVSNVRANDSTVNIDEKGLGIVEGGIDGAVSTDHLSAEPADVDSEVRAFSQHQIMGMHGRGSRLGGGTCSVGGGCRT